MPEAGRKLRILGLEPYDGGSHRAFWAPLARLSQHEFTLLTLPARKWKWRMRGAAMWFAKEVAAATSDGFDLILTNDMLSVADLRALLPPEVARCPIICYFHENQLTYPLSEHDWRDYQFGFTNITSCLAADAVWFNSNYHMHAFLTTADQLLRKMPDFVPEGIMDRIREKSIVLRPLVESPPADAYQDRDDGPPVILWNHRWEYDKNPEPFFEALFQLDAAGVPFRLALLGEHFREIPQSFQSGLKQLESRIVSRGYAKSRDEYWRRLCTGDIVVSTAIQENFGIATAEAILAGCRPLLPNRLAYPELIPAQLRSDCLYETDSDLAQRLRDTIAERLPWLLQQELKTHVGAACSAESCIHIYDNSLEIIVAGAKPPADRHL